MNEDAAAGAGIDVVVSSGDPVQWVGLANLDMQSAGSCGAGEVARGLLLSLNPWMGPVT